MEKVKVQWLIALVVFTICLCAGPSLTTLSMTAKAEVPREKRSDPIDIRLITFSPYDSIFAWFGHSALEVRNRETGKAYTYNFGGFFFGAEHLLEFAFGRFTFWSYALETERALAPYQEEQRHMVFQTLNLTQTQEKRIIRELVKALRPENRFYPYDHFRNNCSTQLRDIIDKAMDGELKKQSSTTADLSYKEYIHRMTYQNPVLNFLLMFLLNDNLDQPITDWDSMFLPDRMMAVLQQAQTSSTGDPSPGRLVNQQKELNIIDGNEYYRIKATVPDTRIREYAIGTIFLFLFGVAAVLYFGINKNRRRILPLLSAFFGLIFGFLGLGLFFMMCFTEHQDTYWNENILLLNPLTFLLFPVGVLRFFDRCQGLFRWLCLLNGTTAVFAVLLKVLPVFDQVNGQQIRVLLPVLIVLGITGIVDIKKQKSHS